ncbi:phosphopantetheine-binding protein [Polynucleobacter sp. MG-27-Goln-C1]|jgi:acyl carrier protein|uniref:phosphopantetheine-binding protein n=1 Tax=Polynucleobacter sp. MG-27-Goln-C1 TaxID=1819726 RepID=UPI001C0CC981|nr:phosphopantetheine-binding protein [Polynucleobacter sp. MG-27-Goln-C1]MBU3611604.1 acyl carrier protein [Polynucleobacter sp. MG-27-Goln-C1]
MSDLELEIKKLIISSLNLEDYQPEDISSEESLFADGLGLDSIDALELGVALQKKYGLELTNVTKTEGKHFYSVATLAKFVAENRTK